MARATPGWARRTYLGGEGRGEVFEGCQLGADVDFIIFVEEDGKEGLGAAGVLDCLRGEEEVSRCVVVEVAVVRLIFRV